MASASNDLDRNLQQERVSARAAAREAAREAAHQARITASAEVRRLIADVEELMRRIGDVADPEIARLRARVEGALASTRSAIAESAAQVQRQTREAVQAGDRYVHDQPWEAIGIAGVAGLAIGFLLGRR
jgi:ElaB/YqjD/DUF883 family membrane-anchored ribosome-binding protein